MNIALTVVHVAACLVLVLVVLLQTGKGADMGAVFGGSSQTLFGSSGAGNFLTRLTTGAAIVFMVTSLTLSYLSSASLQSSLFDSGSPEPPPVEAPLGDVPPLPEAPAPDAAAPAPGAAAPAPQAGEVGRIEIPAQPAPAAEAPAAQAPAAQAPEAAAPVAPAAEPQAAAPAAEAPAAAPN